MAGNRGQAQEPIDPSAATQKYMNKDITLAQYIAVLDRYVPSAESMVRSLDEHEEYVKRVAESLERTETHEDSGGK